MCIVLQILISILILKPEETKRVHDLGLVPGMTDKLCSDYSYVQCIRHPWNLLKYILKVISLSMQ